jgi:hypothetical protein
MPLILVDPGFDHTRGNEIDDLTDRDRDDLGREELEVLRRLAEDHDTLVDALVTFICELDASACTAHWPLRLRITFGELRRLLDQTTNSTN